MVNNKDITFCKYAFYIYFILMIFEGALRKWFLPSLSNALLVAKDPFAIYIVFIACKYGLYKNIFVKLSWLIAFITFVQAMLMGHQNIVIALYGIRIWIYYIPLIFSLPFFINISDITNICKKTIYINIGMTVLLCLQYFTPQTSIFNIGVGGVGSSGFAGVGDYFRPSGTFSFTDGVALFLLLAGCSIWYYFIYNKKFKSTAYFINKYILYVSLICLLISLPVSLSRSVIAQTIILFIIVFILVISYSKNKSNIIKLFCFIIFLLPILFSNSKIRLAVENLSTRFEVASEVEGNFVTGSIVNRSIKYVFDELTDSEDCKLFYGEGIGISSNVAATILTGEKGFLTREGGSDLIENGIIVGTVMFFFKLILLIYLFLKCFKLRHVSIAPLIFVIYCVIYRPGIGQTPNVIGFSIFVAAVTYTLAVKIQQINSIRNGYSNSNKQ